jgi:predicted nucleic acid-binding protein
MVLEKMRYVMTIFTLVVIEMKDAADAVGLCEDSNAVHRDYEDALQYICAKKINAEMIVTNDKGFISPDIDLLATQK